MPYTPPVANVALSSYTAPALNAVNFALVAYELRPKFPLVGQVQLGVTYGVSVELTGTLAAGGGGSGVSRARVVNNA